MLLTCCKNDLEVPSRGSESRSNCLPGLESWLLETGVAFFLAESPLVIVSLGRAWFKTKLTKYTEKYPLPGHKSLGLLFLLTDPHLFIEKYLNLWHLKHSQLHKQLPVKWTVVFLLIWNQHTPSPFSLLQGMDVTCNMWMLELQMCFLLRFCRKSKSCEVQNLLRSIAKQPAHYALECAGKLPDDFVSKDPCIWGSRKHV